MVEKKLVRELIKIYEEAWVNRDPDKIITIFTKDATYFDPKMKKVYSGHDGIKNYWRIKVVEEQRDIKFKLLNIYVDGNTAIAEWDATFYNTKENVKIHLLEVAILEFQGDKIKSLREYYASERL